MEESGHGLILRCYRGIHLKELRKNTKNLSQDKGCLVRDLNPEPPEYEAQVLTTQPRRLAAWMEK
jgi:hypothetical protein